ncbi:2OG-Fe(II) oxygenase [Aurantiacibacter gangjinensis]|uniref:Uncharacterized protein n=1 Tax=Aurantiacibacter gangjinensis TaxID=502682 RepID=A0A0G9MQ78_9SPHN|nr:2OG-Fe(II) oxygenase family protein [Aurantiacibacter gangjinensis]APE28516.1 hypothetical protein BMF35_a1687 [Aurantiacibacter gangjinensis]KLE32719.1 hypothetical protein AAW01_01320 [Aurantiacibacter gangjinensis]
MAKALFALNPDLDRAALAREFAAKRRMQVRNILTDETARTLRDILAHGTEWGVTVQAGRDGQPKSWRGREVRDPAVGREVVEQVKATDRAAAQGDYAFRLNRYSLVEGLQQGWDPGGPMEVLLEHLNAPEFMQLMRDISGMDDLAKADGHASLYAPNHFLGRHNDSHVAEGWRIAYVLNLTVDDWHPDWGGYLVFFDEDGNVETGFKPQFNTLNLFAVPQDHAVTYVPPFAPRGRYAISGWLRDR